MRKDFNSVRVLVLVENRRSFWSAAVPCRFGFRWMWLLNSVQVLKNESGIGLPHSKSFALTNVLFTLKRPLV